MDEIEEIQTDFLKYNHPIRKNYVTTHKENSECFKGSEDKSTKDKDKDKDITTESLQIVLDSMFDIKIQESGDYIYETHVSTNPGSRLDVISLKERLDTALHRNNARETGICPIRRQLYDHCFDEIIRQVTVECVDRGLLLYCIRNEIKMSLKSLEYIKESAVAFGLRAALKHNSLNIENQQKVEKLQAYNQELNIKVDKLNRELMDLKNDRNRLIDDLKKFYENKFENLNSIICSQRKLIDALKRKPVFV